MNVTLANHYRDMSLLDIAPIDPNDYIVKYRGKNTEENECYLLKDGSVLKTIGQNSEAVSVINPSEEYILDVFEGESGNKMISISKPLEKGSSSFFEAVFNGDKLKVIETVNNEDAEYVLMADYMEKKFDKLGLDFESFTNAFEKLNKKETNILNFLKGKLNNGKKVFSSDSHDDKMNRSSRPKF